jgi:hypothetical protein
VSSEDIEKGARWASELDRELQDTHFGIVCLTPENLQAPWILYEAGALTKSIDHGSAVTVLLNVRKNALTYPLARFQATEADRDDFFRLVRTINRRFGEERHADAQLETVFDALWPALDARLLELSQGHQLPQVPARSDRDILEELMATVRRLSGAFDLAAERLGGRELVAEWVAGPDASPSADKRETESPASWYREDMVANLEWSAPESGIDEETDSPGERPNPRHPGT